MTSRAEPPSGDRSPRASPQLSPRGHPGRHPGHGTRDRRSRGPRRPPSPRRLADTPGPDPATPLDQVRLAIGTLGPPHGIAGELRLHLTTDDPEHAQTITRAYLDGEERPRRVTRLRLHGGDALIRFRGVTTPEAARALQGRVVRIAGADARPPAPGEFLLYQVIGLGAVDEAGIELGTVTDLLETGANDVFVISPPSGGPDLLIPNVPEAVLEIVPAEGRMVVRPPRYYGEETADERT